MILRFSPTQLTIILVNGLSITLEPQVWCKLQIQNLFDEIEIQSLRDNTILLEINLDLLLQTLRNFDRANSDGGLNIRLQRKDLSGQQGVTVGNGRTASLALFYSNTNLNSNTINHTFRIPVKILKNTHDAMILREPELPEVDLMVRLPNEFANLFKRLDKFKKPSSSSSVDNSNDLVTIQITRRHGGVFGFVLEEEGKFNVTISWNDKLDIRKSTSTSIQTMLEIFGRPAAFDGAVYADSHDEDKEVVVRLRDWRMASKIVATCKTVVFLIADEDSCVLHCLLDDSGVEIIYYINGTRPSFD